MLLAYDSHQKPRDHMALQHGGQCHGILLSSTDFRAPLYINPETSTTFQVSSQEY